MAHTENTHSICHFGTSTIRLMFAASHREQIAQDNDRARDEYMFQARKFASKRDSASADAPLNQDIFFADEVRKFVRLARKRNYYAMLQRYCIAHGVWTSPTN